MRTLTLISLFAILATGCGSIVVNENYFQEESFIRTNHGPEVPGLASVPENVEAIFKRLPSKEELASMKPEDRAELIEKAVEDASEAGELKSPDSSAAGEGTQDGGRGNVIFIINQSGSTSQDVQAQVEAALEASGIPGTP